MQRPLEEDTAVERECETECHEADDRESDDDGDLLRDGLEIFIPHEVFGK